jgi:tRNA(adenine34) deaminase
MTHEDIMRLALDEAKAALAHDDVPVGAIVMKDGKVLGRGRNRREANANPAGHAEIEALVDAAKRLGQWNLNGAILFVTLEPCAMCAGALVQARISELVYAAEDPKGGALSLGINILDNSKLNHRVKISRGPLIDEASSLLKEFFKQKRRENGTSGRKE